MEGKYLTLEKIIDLDGRSIRLSSPYTEGRFLSISPTGEVTSELPGSGFDQFWRLIQVSDGFLLVSSKNYDMVCHIVTDEGSIVSKPISDDTDDCIWKLGKRGEIYQPNPNGGERYLWLANNKLYATLDGFLAENWIPLFDVNHSSVSLTSSDSESESYDMKIPPFFIVAAVVMMVILVLGLYLQKRH